MNDNHTDKHNNNLTKTLSFCDKMSDRHSVELNDDNGLKILVEYVKGESSMWIEDYVVLDSEGKDVTQLITVAEDWIWREIDLMEEMYNL